MAGEEGIVVGRKNSAVFYHHLAGGIPLGKCKDTMSLGWKSGAGLGPLGIGEEAGGVLGPS